MNRRIIFQKGPKAIIKREALKNTPQAFKLVGEVLATLTNIAGNGPLPGTLKRVPHNGQILCLYRVPGLLRIEYLEHSRFVEVIDIEFKRKPGAKS